jgi:hypothetical protein
LISWCPWKLLLCFLCFLLYHLNNLIIVWKLVRFQFAVDHVSIQRDLKRRFSADDAADLRVRDGRQYLRF